MNLKSSISLFAGKVVLVTRGPAGIGRATALYLSSQGVAFTTGMALPVDGGFTI